MCDMGSTETNFININTVRLDKLCSYWLLSELQRYFPLLFLYTAVVIKTMDLNLNEENRAPSRSDHKEGAWGKTHGNLNSETVPESEAGTSFDAAPALQGDSKPKYSTPCSDDSTQQYFPSFREENRLHPDIKYEGHGIKTRRVEEPANFQQRRFLLKTRQRESVPRNYTWSELCAKLPSSQSEPGAQHFPACQSPGCSAVGLKETLGYCGNHFTILYNNGEIQDIPTTEDVEEYVKRMKLERTAASGVRVPSNVGFPLSEHQRYIPRYDLNRQESAIGQESQYNVYDSQMRDTNVREHAPFSSNTHTRRSFGDVYQNLPHRYPDVVESSGPSDATVHQRQNHPNCRTPGCGNQGRKTYNGLCPDCYNTLIRTKLEGKPPPVPDYVTPKGGVSLPFAAKAHTTPYKPLDRRKVPGYKGTIKEESPEGTLPQGFSSTDTLFSPASNNRTQGASVQRPSSVGGSSADSPTNYSIAYQPSDSNEGPPMYRSHFEDERPPYTWHGYENNLSVRDRQPPMEYPRNTGYQESNFSSGYPISDMSSSYTVSEQDPSYVSLSSASVLSIRFPPGHRSAVHRDPLQ